MNNKFSRANTQRLSLTCMWGGYELPGAWAGGAGDGAAAAGVGAGAACGVGAAEESSV